MNNLHVKGPVQRINLQNITRVAPIQLQGLLNLYNTTVSPFDVHFLDTLSSAVTGGGEE